MLPPPPPEELFEHWAHTHTPVVDAPCNRTVTAVYLPFWVFTYTKSAVTLGSTLTSVTSDECAQVSSVRGVSPRLPFHTRCVQVYAGHKHTRRLLNCFKLHQATPTPFHSLEQVDVGAPVQWEDRGAASVCVCGCPH